MPAQPEAEQPPVLATLEVTSEGVLKGQRFEIRRPLVHVGRGRHNDVLIPDASVSESHAKLQRRDNGWFVVDMESTNGTYVGGKRIVGEFLVDGSPDIRFGGVKFVFRPTPVGDTAGAKGGTHIIAPLRGQLAARNVTPATPRRASAFAMANAIVEPRTQPLSPPRASGLGKVLVGLLILAAFGVALFFYFLSR
jgi:pSer/pThr/pTyr-binding forkhead associated (FHA) protein